MFNNFKNLSIFINIYKSTFVTKAFKLFDMDNDGQITKDELRKLVEKVGGSMTEGEAKGLIHQADKDGNESIDFSEFSKLWAAIKGEGEVSFFIFSNHMPRS